MCLWNTDAPGDNIVKIWQNLLSPKFWPRPTPRAQVMSVKCEKPLEELTVQVLFLYDHPNLKYCALYVSRMELRTDKWTNRRTLWTPYIWLMCCAFVALYNYIFLILKLYLNIPLLRPFCFCSVFKVCRQSGKTFLLLCCLFFFSFISFPPSEFCDFSAIFRRIFLIFGQLIDNYL